MHLSIYRKEMKSSSASSYLMYTYSHYAVRVFATVNSTNDYFTKCLSWISATPLRPYITQPRLNHDCLQYMLNKRSVSVVASYEHGTYGRGSQQNGSNDFLKDRVLPPPTLLAFSHLANCCATLAPDNAAKCSACCPLLSLVTCH